MQPEEYQRGAPLFFRSSPSSAAELGMAAMGHSRRFGFVRFRRHCGHEFLRQERTLPPGRRPRARPGIGSEACLLPALAKYGRSDTQCIFTPFQRGLSFLLEGEKFVH
jgi:hypothetical protein